MICWVNMKLTERMRMVKSFRKVKWNKRKAKRGKSIKKKRKNRKQEYSKWDRTKKLKKIHSVSDQSESENHDKEEIDAVTSVLEVSGNQRVIPLLTGDNVPEEWIEDDVCDRVDGDEVQLEKHLTILEEKIMQKERKFFLLQNFKHNTVSSKLLKRDGTV